MTIIDKLSTTRLNTITNVLNQTCNCLLSDFRYEAFEIS